MHDNIITIKDIKKQSKVKKLIEFALLTLAAAIFALFLYRAYLLLTN